MRDVALSPRPESTPQRIHVIRDNREVFAGTTQIGSGYTSWNRGPQNKILAVSAIEGAGEYEFWTPAAALLWLTMIAHTAQLAD